MTNIVNNFQSYLNQNRYVYRAGWLQYIPFNENIPTDQHRFWVVFSVYHEEIPFLEFYRERQNSKIIGNEGPVSKHSLATCRFINVVITPKESQHYEFVVGLTLQNLRLAADSSEAMLDWINILKNKLTEFKILQIPENQYTKAPELPPRMITTSNATVYEPIFDNEEAPPPYEANISAISNISFRESQVENLKKEISDLDGIKIKVRRKDLLHGVAWVDIAGNGLFIVGWRQKQCPHLHNIFHIGDQILAINQQNFDFSDDARLFLKNNCSHKVELHLRRLPFGQVYCIKRAYDGQELGLIREKRTAEIKYIQPNSLAYNAGLSVKNWFYFENDNNVENYNSNWQITEINNRPLNLFFKNNEVESRLNAIGKEISILVQPTMFVRKLQKQMKNNVKNYKEFLVQ